MQVMKGLVLLGGAVILIGLGIGAASVATPHAYTTRVLPADERQLAEAAYSGADSTDPALQRMIRLGDGEGLFEIFTRTRAIRRGIVAQGQ